MRIAVLVDITVHTLCMTVPFIKENRVSSSCHEVPCLQTTNTRSWIDSSASHTGASVSVSSLQTIASTNIQREGIPGL